MHMKYSSNINNPFLIGTTAVFLASISTYVGAALAKQLFPEIGAYGVTALRTAIAAVLLMVFYRPWRRPVERVLLPSLLVYGATLGLMNLFIYLAFERIPIGIAVAIEVTGPLSVVLFSSRKPLDFLFLVTAIAGLALLLPLKTNNTLDPIGVAFAFGAATCWAGYIVAGKKVSGKLKGDAVAWGVLVAAVLVMPFGVAQSGSALIAPNILFIGLAIALLSSALPYSFEMQAMRKLPTYVFSILLSTAPAISALVGFVILNEVLSLTEWLAIFLIFLASAGAALSAAKK
jgi:inner membrane transporter RhtA